MESDAHIVFVRIDERNRITAVNSSEFLKETDGWVEIDRGDTPRHHHAQGNYFSKPIRDEHGVQRYQAFPFVEAPEGKIVAEFFRDDIEYLVLERSQEEMDADATHAMPGLSDSERIAQLEEELRAAKILLGLEG